MSKWTGFAGPCFPLGHISAMHCGRCSVAPNRKPVPAAHNGVVTSGLPGRRSGTRLAWPRHPTPAPARQLHRPRLCRAGVFGIAGGDQWLRSPRLGFPLSRNIRDRGHSSPSDSPVRSHLGDLCDSPTPPVASLIPRRGKRSARRQLVPVFKAGRMPRSLVIGLTVRSRGMRPAVLTPARFRSVVTPLGFGSRA